MWLSSKIAAQSQLKQLIESLIRNEKQMTVQSNKNHEKKNGKSESNTEAIAKERALLSKKTERIPTAPGAEGAIIYKHRR